MNRPTAPRSSLSGVMFSFGLVTFTVDLLPATVSRASKNSGVSFKMLCPICETASRLQQTYVCCTNPEHHGFSKGDADSGMEVAGELKKLTQLEIDQIKTAAEATTESKRAFLQVCPAEQVTSQTVQGAVSYRLRPTKGVETTYALVMKLLEDDTRAFLCEVAVKGVAKLYRAVEDDGTITLIELSRPEEVYATTAVTAEVDERYLEAAEKLVDAFIEDFNVEDWQDKRAQAFAAVRDSLTPEPLKAVANASTAADDLLALLQKSIDTAKEAA